MNKNQKLEGKLSVAGKILLFVFVSAFTIVAVQTWINVSNARKRNKAAEERSLMAHYFNYKDGVLVLERAVVAIASSFSDRSDIIRLFLAEDRHGLLELLIPTFANLKTRFDITHFSLHETNGFVFLRIHKPEEYGDAFITYRQTILAAIRDKQAVAGVELDPSRLGVRGVAPMFHNDEFIGLVEVGLDYDQAFLEDLKVRNSVNYKLWVTYEAAAPAGLWPKDDEPRSPSSEIFYYAGTSPKSLPIPEAVYNRVLQSGKPEIQFVSDGNQELAVLMGPLFGFQNRIIGIIEISRSREEALATLRKDEMITLAVAIGLAILGLVIIWILTNIVVLRPLGHLTTVAQRQFKGDLAARIDLFPGDEFGLLGHTFNLLSQKLSETLEEQKITITELKQTEAQLTRLATAIEQAAESVIISDKRGIVQYINPAFERISGYTQKDIVGHHLRILKSDKHEEIFFRKMWNIISRGEVWAGRIKNRMKDGTLYEFETRISPVRDSSGEIINFVSVNRDITQQVELEAKLQRAQKMEALGLLAGGVAHDLNNVLSGIVSYPDLILMDLPEKSPLKKPLLTIKSSGEKAAEIVQDLLTLARRGVSTTEILNLNDVLADYLKSPEHLKLTTNYPGVHIEASLDTNLLNIKGSPIHLRKSIMNLVSNAAEAQPAGGSITISTGNIYLDTQIKGYEDIREGDFVVLEVSDNGLGITAEDLDRIFEPFYTKKIMGKSGTGLGMAVVWGTVQDHHGYINVESTEGEGTTFKLYFPVTREKTKRDKDLIPVEEYIGNRQTILVIDDVKEQREIAANILSKLNYSVHTVSGGEEAVEYMKNNIAELLVLDMIMDPGIDGLETYKRIIELHPDQKAIIASGFSETKRVKEAQRLGAGQYIKKPYTLEKIGIAVRDELKK